MGVSITRSLPAFTSRNSGRQDRSGSTISPPPCLGYGPPRDRGYYKDVLGFETFEAYCKAKWDFSRIRAFQLIQSAEIRENVLTIVNIAPATESQTRPLARLEPQQQREAWQKVVETAPEGKVTAALPYA